MMEDDIRGALRSLKDELQLDIRNELRDFKEDLKREVGAGIGSAISNVNSDGFLTFVNTVLLGIILWRIW